MAQQNNWFDSLLYGQSSKAYSPMAAQTMAVNNPSNYTDYMSEFNVVDKNGIGGSTGLLNGPQGMLGGLNSLAGFGKDLFGIYGGMKQLGLAEDQFDLMKKYAALNAGNQGARMKYSMGANNAALQSAGGQPVDRSYRDEVNNIKSSI